MVDRSLQREVMIQRFSLNLCCFFWDRGSSCNPGWHWSSDFPAPAPPGQWLCMYTLVFIPGLMKNRKSWENVIGQESWAKGSNGRKLSKSCPLSSCFPQHPQHPQCLPASLASETGCAILPVSCLHKGPLTWTSYGLFGEERKVRAVPSPHPCFPNLFNFKHLTWWSSIF